MPDQETDPPGALRSSPQRENPASRWELNLDFLHRLRNVLRQELDRFLDDRSVEQLLSIGGVAEALNVSERTVERLVDDGELTPIWIRGQRRFKPESVRSYIRRAAGGSA